MQNTNPQGARTKKKIKIKKKKKKVKQCPCYLGLMYTTALLGGGFCFGFFARQVSVRNGSSTTALLSV